MNLSLRECAGCKAWYSDHNTAEPRCATCRARVIRAGFSDFRDLQALTSMLWAAFYQAHRKHTYIQPE